MNSNALYGCSNMVIGSVNRPACLRRDSDLILASIPRLQILSRLPSSVFLFLPRALPYR